MKFSRFLAVVKAKRVLSLIVFVVLLAGVAGAVFAAQQMQDTRSRASGQEIWGTCQSGKYGKLVNSHCTAWGIGRDSSVCCSGSCKSWDGGVDGSCEAEARPQCLSEGGKCQTSCSGSLPRSEGAGAKGCAAGTYCCKPALSDCENRGGTCVSASSQGVGQCPAGKALDTSVSCGSVYRVCCNTPKAPPCGTGTAAGGSCKYSSCGSNEDYVSGTCSSGSMVCCKPKSGGTNPPPPPNPPPPAQNPPPPPGGNTGECGPAGCCAKVFPGAKCQYTNNACPGGYATNYCPRGNDYKCCKPVPADTTAPSAAVLTATAVSTSQIDLSWTKSTDNVGIKNYTIYRDGAQVGTAPADATSYQDKNLQQETRYKYTIDANDAASNKTKSNEAFATTEKAIVPDTIFSMELLMHGIGRSGDNRNRNGQGNTNPNTKKRNMVVQLFDPNTNLPVLTKDGKVDYDPVSGSFKLATLNMGNTLETKTYIIRVNSQSLRGKVTRDITAGTTNIIPVMTLVNGDANWDGKLDIEDYHMINGCIRDFDLPPADCDSVRAQKADLDDDGTVGIFDLNLFIRELSVQEL